MALLPILEWVQQLSTNSFCALYLAKKDGPDFPSNESCSAPSINARQALLYDSFGFFLTQDIFEFRLHASPEASHLIMKQIAQTMNKVLRKSLCIDPFKNVSVHKQELVCKMPDRRMEMGEQFTTLSKYILHSAGIALENTYFIYVIALWLQPQSKTRVRIVTQKRESRPKVDDHSLCCSTLPLCWLLTRAHWFARREQLASLQLPLV